MAANGKEVLEQLKKNSYDLVFMEQDAESTPIKAMLDALSSRRFAREVSQLCAYDTAQMGQAVSI